MSGYIVQVIVYLETGTGKTLIAALLVKHFLDKERTNGGSQDRPRNIVCLEPKAMLVEQQAAVFRKVVQVPVGEYTGSHGVDSWTAQKWEEEYRCSAHLGLTQVASGGQGFLICDYLSLSTQMLQA
jgi:endoribonuclease Dicer